MQAQIQSNVNKAYVALQASTSNPSNTALPGVINTRRPKLSSQQIAARYLKSIAGNPDIDIAKVSRMVVRDRMEHALPLSGLDASTKAAPRRDAHGQRSGDDIIATMRKRGVAERSAILDSGYKWRNIRCPDYHWALPECRDDFPRGKGRDIGEFELIGLDPSPSKCSVTFLDPSLLATYEAKFPLSEYKGQFADDGSDLYENTYVLADAELCSRLALRGFNNCSVLSSGNQVEQIENFLSELPHFVTTLIVVSPDVIERWGRTNDLLPGWCAYAIRSDLYKTSTALSKIFSPILGLMIVGSVAFYCHEKITESARRVKQAMQRCFNTSAQTNNDEPVDDADENPDGDNRNDVDTKSSIVIDMNEAKVSSSSAYLGDSSSSSGQGREANATLRADNAPGRAEADIDTGEETSDALV